MSVFKRLSSLCGSTVSILGSAGIATALAGCASVGPDFVAPQVPAPAGYREWHGGDDSLTAPVPSGSAHTIALQWAELGDATLQALLRRAAVTNADVQTSAVRVLQARTLERTAAAERGPTLSGWAGETRERFSESGASTRLVSAIPGADHTQILSILGEPFTVFQAGFDASWELDLWGRVRRSVQAAHAQSAQAEADSRQMRLVIAAELAKTYFQLRSTQRQLAIAQQEWTSGRDSEDVLRARTDGGLADETPWLRQRAQDQQLEAAVEQLRAREASTLNRLTLLCGDRPGALNAMLAQLPADAGIALPDLALGVPGELVRNRPDVQSAEQRLAAATANVGIAVADLYPRITLGASFGFESLKADQLSDWASRQWTIGPSLSLPVFDSGRRRATVQLRELQQQEAAIAFQHVVLQAWHEVDDSIASYRAEQVVLAAAVRHVRDSEASHSIAQARFLGGLTDDLPALAADRDLSQARRAQAQSSERLETSLVGIYKALGDLPERDK